MPFIHSFDTWRSICLSIPRNLEITFVVVSQVSGSQRILSYNGHWIMAYNNTFCMEKIWWSRWKRTNNLLQLILSLATQFYYVVFIFLKHAARNSHKVRYQSQPNRWVLRSRSRAWSTSINILCSSAVFLASRTLIKGQSIPVMIMGRLTTYQPWSLLSRYDGCTSA